jgi:hypothetical protein
MFRLVLPILAVNSEPNAWSVKGALESHKQKDLDGIIDEIALKHIDTVEKPCTPEELEKAAKNPFFSPCAEDGGTGILLKFWRLMNHGPCHIFVIQENARDAGKN